jgi:hypothetical protein
MIQDNESDDIKEIIIVAGAAKEDEDFKAYILINLVMDCKVRCFYHDSEDGKTILGRYKIEKTPSAVFINDKNEVIDIITGCRSLMSLKIKRNNL